MKLSEFIKELSECLELNGDIDVAVCVDGKLRHLVDLNAVEDTVYVEGYMPRGLGTIRL